MEPVLAKLIAQAEVLQQGLAYRGQANEHLPRAIHLGKQMLAQLRCDFAATNYGDLRADLVRFLCLLDMGGFFD